MKTNLNPTQHFFTVSLWNVFFIATLTFVFCLIGIKSLKAQTNICSMPFDSVNFPVQYLSGKQANPYDCNHYDSYAPYVPHHTPIKYVHVNVHLIYKGDTTTVPPPGVNKYTYDSIRYGNLYTAFGNGEDSLRNWIQGSLQSVDPNPLSMDHVWGLSSRYANLDTSNIIPPSPYNTPYIRDSRIRFLIDTILLHFNDSLYYLGDTLDAKSAAYPMINTMSISIINGLSVPNPNAVNIFIFGPVSGSGYAGGTGTDYYNRAFCSGYIDKAGHEDPAMIRHEVGHVLGLSHGVKVEGTSIEQDTLDDTAPYPQNLGCWNGPGCSNNIMDYNASEHALSAWQIGRIHAFLMNLEPGHIWRALEPDHCTFHPGETISIDSGEVYTWKGEKWLKGDLVVRKGGDLTIKCKVSLPKDARVVVEGGAKLTLDGGTLTNVCNDLWKGVYVLGDNTKPQTDTLAQGRIIMKNLSVIENAHTGVTLIDWDANGPIWHTTGGIIQADSSYFLNNVRGIAFLSYKNKVGNVELNNVSTITSCRFEINQALKNGRKPYTFISMYDVKNVKLWNNHFINTHYPQAFAGMGIYTEYATLKVNTPSGYGPNIFQNLQCGIKVNEFNSAHQSVIQKTDFINNYGGIHLNNTAYAVVTENNFQIMGYDSTMTDPCGSPDGYHNTFGIHLVHSDRYKVEANDLTTYGTLNTSGYPNEFDNQTGIIVSHSGTGANQIYRNTFHDLIVGNKVQGINGLAFGPAGTGLEFKCNNFTDEVFKTAIGVVPKGRIAYMQGKLVQGDYSNSQNPAGNEFRQTTSRSPSDTLRDIWYTEPDLIIYTHHLDSFCIPRKYQLGSVVLQQAPVEKDSLSCPSNLTPIIIGGGVSARFAEFIELRDSAQSITDSLTAAAHDSLFYAVRYETPAVAYAIVQPFIPLLSDKILNQVAEHAADTLAPEYFDLLLQHSPLSPAVWENMAAIPFDSAQAADLMDAQTPDWSVRDLTFFRSSELTMQRDLLRNDAIRWWLEEDDSSGRENILTLLQLCPVMESKIHLSDMYIKLEMWSEAETLLDSIESADDGYLSYTRIQKELLPAYTENGGIKTQVENTDLLDLLAHVGHTAKGKGKLTALDHIISEHPPCPEAMRLFIPEEIPPGERRGLVPVQVEELYPEALYVYPNPSDGKLNIRFQSEETTPAKLIIRDIQGKTVYQENGLSPNREYNISTLTLPPGVYFMDVNNGRQTWQKKWVKN